MERTVPTLNMLETKGSIKMSKYWDKRPDVVQIFDDLDSYRDFCRFNGFIFNEADLYNKKSRTYQSYLDPSKISRKPKRKFNKRKFH